MDSATWATGFFFHSIREMQDESLYKSLFSLFIDFNKKRITLTYQCSKVRGYSHQVLK